MPEMTERDIVERLRATLLDRDNLLRLHSEQWLPVGLAKEAADEIERLTEQLKLAVWTDSEHCKLVEAGNELLRAESERETGRAETAIETLNETRDEIELLRKQLLAPTISWDGFLVSGMQESIDEVCRLIDLEKRGHK
jgi:hypothetical protein